MNANTPLWQLTVAEFKELMMECTSIKVNALEQRPAEENIVVGLKGLSELLGMSISKAGQLKRSGMLDSATSQLGRKLYFNKQKVLAIIDKENIAKLTKRYCKK